VVLIQTRRGFLGGIAAAGTAGLIRTPRALAAEGTLQTTSVRIGKSPGICVAPEYLAEELLRAEGFTDVRYVEQPATATEPLAHGKVDFDMNYASNFVRAIDAGRRPS
jgi:NitT/TauT family transport system substrate-binding protein